MSMRITQPDLECRNCGKAAGEHRFLDGACPYGKKDAKGYYPSFYTESKFQAMYRPYARKAQP